MALSAQEKEELKALESEVGGLSMAEAAELDQLEAEKSAGPSLGDQALAAVQGFGQSATFGLLPQLQAGAEAVTEDIGSVFGVGPLAERQELRQQGFQIAPEQTFGERSQGAAQSIQRSKEASPGAFLGGEVGGFLVPGAGAAKIAGAVPKIGQALRAGGGLAQTGKAIGITSAGGGLQGLAETGLEAQTRGDLEDVQGRLERGATGAIFGPVALGFGRALSAAPKKLLSVFGGVRTDIIDKYLANPRAIKDAEELGREGVEKIIDDAMAPIRTNLADSTIDLRSAKELTKMVEDSVVTEFRREKTIAKEALKRAERGLEKSFNRSVQELQDIPPPTVMADQVGETLEGLKRQLIEGSEQSTDIIAKNLPDEIDISAAFDVIDSEVARLMLNGKPIPGFASKISDMAALKEEFLAIGDVNGRQIKALIKGIDRSIDIDDVAGSFDEPVNVARKKVRRALDDILKADPEYAEAMIKVREDAALLEINRKLFGDPARRLRKLRLIDSDANITDRESLEILGNRMGFDFAGEVDNFIALKAQIKDLKNRGIDSPARQQFIKELPEFQSVKEAQEALDAVDFLDRQDLAEKLAADVRSLQTRESLDAAQQKLDLATEAADSVKGFMREGSPESKIRQYISVMSSGNQTGTAIKSEFEKMSKLADDDLLSLVENLRVNEVFDQEFTRGSRNVNLWAVMAASSNFLVTGDLMATGVGALTGAGIGSMIDKFGPKATKQVLSFIANSRGIMTRNRLKNAAIDDNVKSDLLIMFDQAVLRGVAKTQVIPIPAEDIELVRTDIQKRTDLSNVEKAKMINSLNSKGQIEQPAKYLGSPATVDEARKKGK